MSGTTFKHLDNQATCLSCRGTCTDEIAAVLFAGDRSASLKNCILLSPHEKRRPTKQNQAPIMLHNSTNTRNSKVSVIWNTTTTNEGRRTGLVLLLSLGLVSDEEGSSALGLFSHSSQSLCAPALPKQRWASFSGGLLQKDKLLQEAARSSPSQEHHHTDAYGSISATGTKQLQAQNCLAPTYGALPLASRHDHAQAHEYEPAACPQAQLRATLAKSVCYC